MVPADAVGARGYKNAIEQTPSLLRNASAEQKSFFCSQRRMTLSGVIDLDEE